MRVGNSEQLKIELEKMEIDFDEIKDYLEKMAKEKIIELENEVKEYETKIKDLNQELASALIEKEVAKAISNDKGIEESKSKIIKKLSDVRKAKREFADIEAYNRHAKYEITDKFLNNNK